MKTLRVPKVLVLMCDADERAILHKVLELHAELTCVCTPQEMAKQLEHDSYDALFCARSLSVGSWREVVEGVRQIDSHLPVIIVSKTAGEQEWVEVLQAGGFDLLGPPYYERVCLSVLEHAVLSHEGRLWHGKTSPQESR